MNDSSKLSKELPDTTQVFQLDLTGVVTKKRFLGEFKCKIPTLKDQALIGKYESMLNGEYPIYLNPGVLKLNKMIAYLKFTIDDCPIFWKSAEYGYTLMDLNIVEGVYNEVLRFEESWINQVWGVTDDNLKA
jgi:hypothetical protein